MQKLNLGENFRPGEFDIFAGLDVDKKSIAATFLDNFGQMKQIKIPYDSTQLINFINNRYSNKKVAFVYESGPTGFGLYDDLTAANHFCMVTSASKVPTEPGTRVKTNRIDSKKLSENLRGGQLKSIHIPTESYRELRHLVQLRDTSVRQSTSTKARIKSLLLVKGIPFPEETGDRWSVATIRRLKEIKCSGPIRFHLDQLLKSLEFFHTNVLETTRLIRNFCRTDKEINKNIGFITSIPGIGFTTASQLIARIGDWRQLYRFDQLGSFVGLVPSEHSTGENVQRGHITRMGNADLRGKLIQCAWIAIRIDPELKEFYLRLYERNQNSSGSKKAITAVARKLTTRIYAVLTQQRNYKIKADNELSKG